MFLTRFYLCEGNFLLPHVVRVNGGYTWETAPVAKIPAADVDTVASTLAEPLRHGPPNIPQPDFSGPKPKPAVLSPAGVKSWSAFEKRATLVTVDLDGTDYVVEIAARDDKGRWSEGSAFKGRVPVASGPRAVVEAVLAALAHPPA